MTANDLQEALTAGMGHMKQVFRDITSNRVCSLILKFPDRNGAVDLDAERRFAARLLKKSGRCRTALVIDPCTVRVDGIPSRFLPALLEHSTELGASQWMLLA